MKAKALVVAAIAVAGILGIRVRQSNSVVIEPSDAPFRDGRFIGQLAAERGDNPRIPVGRWTEPKDRRSFAEGCRLAYDEMIAKRHRSHKPDSAKLMAAVGPAELTGTYLDYYGNGTVRNMARS